MNKTTVKLLLSPERHTVVDKGSNMIIILRKGKRMARNTKFEKKISKPLKIKHHELKSVWDDDWMANTLTQNWTVRKSCRTITRTTSTGCRKCLTSANSNPKKVSSSMSMEIATKVPWLYIGWWTSINKRQSI